MHDKRKMKSSVSPTVVASASRVTWPPSVVVTGASASPTSSVVVAVIRAIATSPSWRSAVSTSPWGRPGAVHLSTFDFFSAMGFDIFRFERSGLLLACISFEGDPVTNTKLPNVNIVHISPSTCYFDWGSTRHTCFVGKGIIHSCETNVSVFYKHCMPSENFFLAPLDLIPKPSQLLHVCQDSWTNPSKHLPQHFSSLVTGAFS